MHITPSPPDLTHWRTVAEQNFWQGFAWGAFFFSCIVYWVLR